MTTAKVLDLDEEALRRIGRRLDEAWKNERDGWVERSLAIMGALREGRERFPSNPAFGAWLKKSGHDHWNRSDRAALLALAIDPLRARDVLTQTSRRSYQWILKEVKGSHLHHVMKKRPRKKEAAASFDVDDLPVKDKLTVEKAIHLLRARQEKEFATRVNDEVLRRIAAADDATRSQNTKLRRENAYLAGLISQRAVFTGAQFNRLMMCTHPDNSASTAVRNEMQALLIENKRRLVKQEQR